MTKDAPDPSRVDRRTALKLVGGTATAAGFGGTAATVAAARDEESALDRVVSDRLNPHDPAPQEALVTFTSNRAVTRLAEVGAPFRRFEVLPVGWTELTGRQIREVAGWEEVLRVEATYELELQNHTSKESANVDAVRASDELDYRGEGIHAAVVDTGINPQHPAFDSIVHNWQFVGDPAWTYNAVDQYDPLFVDAGPAPTDDEGHGTHCAGSLAGSGDGSQDDNDYSGMAPGADLTAYNVTVNSGVLNAAVTAAYDHMVARQRAGEDRIHLTSNSYGDLTGGGAFNPFGPVTVAFWYATQAGILVLKAAGNAGPDPESLGAGSRAPFVLSVAAADPDDSVSDFSSRGVPEGRFDRRTALRNVTAFYDEHLEAYNYCNIWGVLGVGDCNNAPTEPPGDLGLQRPGVIAKGGSVFSAVTPGQNATGRISAPTEPFYGRKSGTSMACPTAAGVVAVFLSAWKDQHGEVPNPIDTITTMEATANVLGDGYEAISSGAGYVDAAAAVRRALEGELGTPEEVTFTGQVPTTTCPVTVNRDREIQSVSKTAQQTPNGGPYTTTMRLSAEDGFAEVDLPNRRLVAQLNKLLSQYLPEEDPNMASLVVDRQVGEEAYERVGTVSHDGPTDTAQLELVVEDGDVYEGPGTGGESVENEVVVDDDNTYRVTATWEHPPVDTTTELVAKLQAYRPDCVDG